jgi:hypothetical protein
MVAGLWISPGTPVPSANKTNRHDIAEILLKVALNIKAMTLKTTKLKRKVKELLIFGVR